MHELSLVMSILEIVEQEIGQRCGGSPRGRVPSLTVRVGSLSGVEPEALSFAWDVAREQGSFPEAELRIEKIEAKAVCNDCGGAFFLGEGGGECGACGPVGFRVIEGQELEVTQILWEPEGDGQEEAT
jgi:hydrogenase nickel incorporation protein HypA/HybF